MRERLRPLALTAVIVALGSPGSAQTPPNVSVSVQPPGVVQIVLVAANAAETVLTTTDQRGQGSIESRALAKLGRLEVIDDTCGDRKRVLLVASSGRAAVRAGCRPRPIGFFTPGSNGTLKAELFTPLPRPAAIPDVPVREPAAAPQRATASPAQPPAVRSPAPPAATAGPCPPGASMVGAKLDLPAGANSLEKAPLLVPCVYRGVEDTEPDRWRYYRVQVEKGQTLKVTARMRDAELPPRPRSFGDLLFVRVHDTNGGVVGSVKSIGEASGITQLEYKAVESGAAFVSMSWVVRDAAFLVSVQ